MARPSKNAIDSGIQNWDGKIDDNDSVLFNGPIPIHEHVGDETNIEVTFPAAMYDRCFVWVNHTILGFTLYVSDGTLWLIDDARERAFINLTSTTSMALADQFVQFTGVGTVNYNLLPVAQWIGQTCTIRNDKTTGTLNIDPNGLEVINALAGGAPFILTIGSTATIYNNGTQLYISVSL